MQIHPKFIWNMKPAGILRSLLTLSILLLAGPCLQGQPMAQHPEASLVPSKEEVAAPGNTLILRFMTGWNLFSIPFLPETAGMKELFQPLIDNGTLVKIQNQAGKPLENLGPLGGWTNHIGDLSLAEGYRIRVKADCSLQVTGLPAANPFEIPLKTGWNIMGFPKATSTNGMAVVAQLIGRGSLVKVQDEAGNTIEDTGSLGSWVNQIGDFYPGKGYLIKVNREDILELGNLPEGNETGTLTDARDGHVYKTVKIGTQWWMAENLAYLPFLNPPVAESATQPFHYVYDNQGTDVTAAKASANYLNYGVLYNWTAALTACPQGWHLPSDAEWYTLSDYLTNNGYGFEGSGSDIAKAMASTTLWNGSPTAGTPGNDLYLNDWSGFGGRPAGYLSNDDHYYAMGFMAYWWAADSYSDTDARVRLIYHSADNLARNHFPKNQGFSVRCIKD